MEKRHRPSRTAAIRFGENLRALRQRDGMTLADLATALEQIGYPMSLNTLSKIERGARNIELDDAVVLAGLWRMDLADMLVDLDQPDRPYLPRLQSGVAAFRLAALDFPSHVGEVRAHAQELVDLADELEDLVDAIPGVDAESRRQIRSVTDDPLVALSRALLELEVPDGEH